MGAHRLSKYVVSLQFIGFSLLFVRLYLLYIPVYKLKRRGGFSKPQGIMGFMN